MSFINKIITPYDELLEESFDSYSYSDYALDMLNIEKSLNEAINTYLRTINESAIELLLEDNSSSTDLMVINNNAKDELDSKLKKIWEDIKSAFVRVINNIYNWFYEQVVLKTKYIKSYEEEILKTTIVYGKQTQAVYKTDGSLAMDPFVVTLPQYELDSYSKLLDFKSINPLMTEVELSKYCNDDGIVNKDEIYNFYHDTMLGSKTKLSIEKINSSKKVLIDNLNKVYNGVKSRKEEISKIKSIKIPKNLTNNQVISLRAYIKVLLEFCKEDSKLLRLFIKNSNKGENKKSVEKEDK